MLSVAVITDYESLPMRERGLKPLHSVLYRLGQWSLPMRERGLKPDVLMENAGTITVAPYAGAWIETLVANPAAAKFSVAPYAGAWIETPYIFQR